MANKLRVFVKASEKVLGMIGLMDPPFPSTLDTKVGKMQLERVGPTYVLYREASGASVA